MTLAPLIRFSRASPPSRHRSMSHRFPRAPLYLNCLPQCSTSTLEALPDMSLTPVAPLYLNCLPQCSTSTLEALPDMSLTPVAPFTVPRNSALAQKVIRLGATCLHHDCGAAGKKRRKTWNQKLKSETLN